MSDRGPRSAAPALARRFVLAEQSVRIGRRVVQVLKPRNLDDLLSEEDFALDERLPYWADLWPSSIVLANALTREPGAGTQLLELGCGLGLVTIAAMIAGYDVLATDYYEDALLFTRENARRALGREPAVRLVNWRRPPDDLGPFERIAAADVLYEREYGTLIAEMLARLLAPSGHATIADPGRVAAPEFAERCAEFGLQVDARREVPYREGTIRQRIRLYEVRRPASAA